MRAHRKQLYFLLREAEWKLRAHAHWKIRNLKDRSKNFRTVSPTKINYFFYIKLTDESLKSFKDSLSMILNKVFDN